ncbi:hypothetical protein COT66_01555 [Candidatus Shapirobacteria bacterium CG09_land_8_20_14_0_10_49_15]|uniref:Uncharacterized protein n=1 Tax=Candidatus Shapirobacteria bacterium CG09_land_8_20_14_0_10_49_15 TaxID=1974482 RepID=A0A2M6XB11_9BACT|nr:MAG: hypothetical protein COT66_01555 [Candidatus Shapirobacteria bacterium CG09_land_8_20_14_0_10_49_15]
MAEIGEMVVQVAEASEASPEELAQQLRRFENNIFQPDPDKEAIRQEANELFPALTRCFFPQESTGQEEVCEQITAAGIEAVLRKTPLSVYMTVLGGTTRFVVRIPRGASKPGEIPVISVVNPQNGAIVSRANETLKQLYAKAYSEATNKQPVKDF